METWLKVVALSIGGTLGVNARYWLGAWMSRWTSPQFPWATFVINVSGSFLIGFLTVALTRWMPHPNVRLLVITGFLGGYTTFSTFENDNVDPVGARGGYTHGGQPDRERGGRLRGRRVGDGPGPRADRARDRASRSRLPGRRDDGGRDSSIPPGMKTSNRSPRRAIDFATVDGQQGTDDGSQR